MGCVYMVTNKINNKVYIGKTVRGLEQRKAQHLLQVKKDNNILFYRAMRKHGVKSFLWSKIFESEDNDVLIAEEIKAIKKYNSTNRNLGYNLTIGGEGISGYCFSDEGKKNISKGVKKHYELHPEKIKLLSKRAKKMFIDKPYLKKEVSIRTTKYLKNKWKDPEYRSKNTTRMQSYRNHASVKIVCYETKEIFLCISDAAKKYNVNEASIRETLDLYNRSSCGYHWLRIDKYNDRIFMNKFKKDILIIKPVNSSKKVRCISTGEVFETLTAAGLKHNANRSAIARACNILGAKSSGLLWEFV